MPSRHSAAISRAAPFASTTTAAHAPGSYHEADGRADAHRTPGVANPSVTQATIHSTICVPGWTKTVRPPAAYTNLLKTSQMKEYGLPGVLSDYEEDHLIPLAAGGNPTDPRNLWPEPWNGTAGAHVKDANEVRAQRDICAGRITLAEDQRRIVERWTHL